MQRLDGMAIRLCESVRSRINHDTPLGFDARQLESLKERRWARLIWCAVWGAAHNAEDVRHLRVGARREQLSHVENANISIKCIIRAQHMGPLHPQRARARHGPEWKTTRILAAGVMHEERAVIRVLQRGNWQATRHYLEVIQLPRRGLRTGDPSAQGATSHFRRPAPPVNQISAPTSTAI